MSAETIPQLPYTVQQVADMYGMKETAVLAEIRSGRLRARHKRGMVKRWFITNQDLVDWVNGMLED